MPGQAHHNRLLVASEGDPGWTTANRTLVIAQATIYFPHGATAATAPDSAQNLRALSHLGWSCKTKWLIHLEQTSVLGWDAGELVRVTGIRPSGYEDLIASGVSADAELVVNDGHYSYFKFVVSGADASTSIRCNVTGYNDGDISR